MGLLDLSQTLLATVQAKGVVPNNWPWIPIVTGVLALIGAIAGTWINAYLTRGREADAHERVRLADFLYLAVTVSATLDSFASQCAAVVSDDGMRYGQRDYTNSAQGELVVQSPAPKLELAGLDVVWKSMPVDLLDQVHSLPVKLANAKAYLDFVAEFDSSGDGSDYFADRRLKYAKIGVATVDVLTALRARAGLRPQIDEEDTTARFLREQLEERTRLAEEARQRQDEWTREISQKLESSS
ncbi:hypothetical protein [Xanthomonas arboricola]|uniref:hypothetical protein n=1 Tax=Xanthomonas arboricola TaxID=56448 RepID=UPI0011B07B5C|nr:hypothetical protein [Xanthomonas arboricola]